jgi:hypothetical protein
LEKHDKELLLMLTVKMLLVAGVGVLIYMGLTSFMQKSDPWPPRDAEDEARIIGEYKHRLLIGDSPLSELKPETAALYLARIIDHAVKQQDWKTASEYSGQAVDRKLSAEVQKAMTQKGAREIIDKVSDGRLKRDALNRIVVLYEQRPPASAPADARAKFEGELREAIDIYRKVGFDAEACPELVAEMTATYRNKLAGWKGDPRLREVLAETERCCSLK